jgi:large subunit ribosomal protein L22
MEAKSRQRYIIMSPRKIRRVIKEIRGKNVVEAADILHFMPYSAARVVEKNLHAAVANAEQLWSVSPEELYVSEVFADDGPSYTRFKPRAQGRIYRRIKRTAHLTLTVGTKNSDNYK